MTIKEAQSVHDLPIDCSTENIRRIMRLRLGKWCDSATGGWEWRDDPRVNAKPEEVMK